MGDGALLTKAQLRVRLLVRLCPRLAVGVKIARHRLIPTHQCPTHSTAWVYLQPEVTQPDKVATREPTASSSGTMLLARVIKTRKVEFEHSSYHHFPPRVFFRQLVIQIVGVGEVVASETIHPCFNYFACGLLVVLNVP